MISKKQSNYHNKNKNIIRKNILLWYDKFGRHNLPWKNKSIYHIWISEIMLQQTQVNTVIPYYTRFIKEIPTLKKLIDSKLDDIMALWSGLGFYRRAINIHKTCLIIKNKHFGKFPTTYDEIIKLPGIGRTTASAILTFSGNGVNSILDGNVKRFIQRLYSVMNEKEGKDALNQLWFLSENLLSKTRPSDFIQAYMDLGSLVCKKTNPKCESCPVRNYCITRMNNSNLSMRLKSTRKKIKHKKLWTLMLVDSTNNRLYLEKISYMNLWKGLYSSPLFSEKLKLDKWLLENNLENLASQDIWQFNHKLSHIEFLFNVRLCKINYNKKISLMKDNWYNLSDINIGIPRYQNKIIKRYIDLHD